jgi:predicted nucleic acid-binding protein
METLFSLMQEYKSNMSGALSSKTGRESGWQLRGGILFLDQDGAVEEQDGVETLSLSLDKGEAEAIVLSKEKESLLIIDDGAGRKAAELMGVKITGILGILLLALKDGKLSLRETMDELKSVGFRLSEKEYMRILSLD